LEFLKSNKLISHLTTTYYANQRRRKAARRSRLSSINEFEYSLYSQSGEDGILKEIFSRLPNNRFFVEFGVQSGEECNAGALARVYNWSGVMIECDDRDFGRLSAAYAQYNVRCLQEFITRENITTIFDRAGVPKDLDLLSIDIDGNDYWVWEAIAKSYNPSVVIVEYNATFGPEASLTQAYNPEHAWSKTDRSFGATLTALWKLGQRLGYSLIGTTTSGINAFFVRNDLVTASGFPALTPREGFHPNSGYLKWFPARPGVMVEV
jgi:hypothetical protein